MCGLLHWYIHFHAAHGNFVRTNVTFDPGATNGSTISTVIDVQDNFVVEGTETFTISGSVAVAQTSFVPGRDTANITIRGNDCKSD